MMNFRAPSQDATAAFCPICPSEKNEVPVLSASDRTSFGNKTYMHNQVRIKSGGGRFNCQLKPRQNCLEESFNEPLSTSGWPEGMSLSPGTAGSEK